MARRRPISYYNVSVEGMIATLEKARNLIERYALIDPQRFWHFLHHLIPGEHFLTAALDIAGWDLFARMRRKPLWQMLGIEWGANARHRLHHRPRHCRRNGR